MNQPIAKKQFGQHFLINMPVVERIAQSVPSGAHALEIGPGPGVLTKKLLERCKSLTVVELDPRMVEHLNEIFAQDVLNKKLTILHEDATTLNYAQFSCSAIVGNLPYNVGTSIVFQVLETASMATHFTWMLQKEVVDRFVASPKCKDYGSVSIKLQWCTEVEDRFLVKPGSFSPPPKVDSSVVQLRRKATPLANPLQRNGDYDAWRKLVDRAFQQRRKMLRSRFEQLKTHPVGTRRPEELSPEEWVELCRELSSHSSIE